MNTRTTRDGQTLVRAGTTPDGRAIYRPLTPGAQALLADMVRAHEEMEARAATPARKAPVRTGPPHWFWAGLLLLLAGVLAFIVWAVVTVWSILVAMFATALGAAFIGALVRIALTGNGPTFVQNNRVG